MQREEAARCMQEQYIISDSRGLRVEIPSGVYGGRGIIDEVLWEALPASAGEVDRSLLGTPASPGTSRFFRVSISDRWFSEECFRHLLALFNRHAELPTEMLELDGGNLTSCFSCCCCGCCGCRRSSGALPNVVESVQN